MLANMLLDEGGGRGSWKTVDDVLVRLIGERDSMNADDMTAFMADVGVGDLEGLAKASDEKLYGALIHSPYGIQRIMSQIMFTDPVDPPVVLPRVYLRVPPRVRRSPPCTVCSYVPRVHGCA